MSVSIRPAVAADAPTILVFVRELAEYEQMLDQVEAGEADFAEALFGRTPRVFAEIAEVDGAPVGFALWFYTFSTFRGRHGIYLEDLYVRPEARGAGVGKALLQGLARRCVEERLGRLEWAVLDWNAPAIGFYDSIGSATLDDWVVRRLTGEALEAMAAG